MAVPAEPILASVLWEAQRMDKSNVTTTTTPLRTGFRAVDEALTGSIEYSSITGIHTEEGSGADELCEALLQYHLLKGESCSVTVVDIGSTFDVRHVYQSIVKQMKGVCNAHDKALEVLKRLNIIKVFDFEGLADAVSEVRRGGENDKDATVTGQDSGRPLRGAVQDSESEDDLLSSPPRRLGVDNVSPQSSPYTSLLLIKNFHQVISPLLKAGHVQAQALLINFMRSLRFLTKERKICTVITSGTTSFNQWKEASPSAFASCTLRPVLGKAFSHMLDSEIMVHHSTVGSKGKENADDRVSIVEVLQTRHGKGIGRWAPFVVEEDGMISPFA